MEMLRSGQRVQTHTCIEAGKCTEMKKMKKKKKKKQTRIHCIKFKLTSVWVEILYSKALISPHISRQNKQPSLNRRSAMVLRSFDVDRLHEWIDKSITDAYLLWKLCAVAAHCLRYSFFNAFFFVRVCLCVAVFRVVLLLLCNCSAFARAGVK